MMYKISSRAIIRSNKYSKTLFIAILLLNISDIYASLVPFISDTFSNADMQAQQERANEPDPIQRIEKISGIYGAAIAKVIKKAMEEETNENTLIHDLHPYLLRHFNIKQGQESQNKDKSSETSPEERDAFMLIGENFDKFENNTNDYTQAIANIIALTKELYGTTLSTRIVILDTFEKYVQILLKENAIIQQIFRKKTIPNAAKQILSEELKNKTPVESRMIINTLINTIIDQADARPSPETFDKKGKEITQNVINWFADAQATNIDTISDIVQQKLKEHYSPDTLYILLTALKNFLNFAVTPASLPKATAWSPPPSCPWYDLKCSIPWDKIGDGLKDIFADRIGGALKTAFVDNVYEKGLKNFGDEVVKEFTVCLDVKVLKAKRLEKIALRETIFSGKLTNAMLDAAQETAIQPLIGARKAAQGTLDTAKAFLQKAGRPIATGTIGAAQTSATGFLSAGETVATGVLTGVDETVQTMLSTFDIQHIRYEGSLQELAKGSLGNVTCKATIVGKSFDFNFDLDVKGPIESLKNLTNKIKDVFVDEAKKAVNKLQEGAQKLHLSSRKDYNDMIMLTLTRQAKYTDGLINTNTV